MTFTVHTTAAPMVPMDPLQALGPGPWLVIAPHDDDAQIGMGMTIHAAVAAGIEVHIAVVTDGRMGWDDPADREQLVKTRAEEMTRASATLGVPADHLHPLGFPDGSLHLHQGCRPDAEGGGLGRVLTRLFRTVRPGTVFCATEADLHPDHRYTASETAMALAWASGAIWRELGTPIDVPRLWHYAVYCDFPHAPQCRVTANAAAMQAKINSLACFASQPFIADMVARLRADGPVEFFGEMSLRPYRPEHYARLFPVGSTDTVLRADAAMVIEGLDAWQPWPALEAALAHPLRLVGEGSSRLFVAGFARHLLRTMGVQIPFDSCGGRSADAGSPTAELIVSNSGATRELVEHIDAYPALQRLALLGLGDGPIAQRIPERRVVLPRPETAVAATASVFLQAFTLGAAIATQAGIAVPMASLRQAVVDLLDVPIPEALQSALVGTRRIWWADAETGIADELALKTAELCGLLGIAAPGTMALHGLEEVFQDGDRVIWLHADARDAALREKVAATTGTPQIILPDLWPLPDLGVWRELLLLVQGWRLLGHGAAALGRDPAKPTRARKVGNPLPISSGTPSPE